MEKYNYRTSGTCAREINFEIDNGIVRNVMFVNGCAGNTVGVGKLIEGMAAEEVIARLENIDCGGRGTSCPDQLAKAIKHALESEQSKEQGV